MASNIDMSLDDIIAGQQSRGQRFSGRRPNNSSDDRLRRTNQGGIRKNFSASNRNIFPSQSSTTFKTRRAIDDTNWQHDLFQTVVNNNNRGGATQNAHTIEISNLHFDVSDADIKELFSEFGQIIESGVEYDRSGRSLGRAKVAFSNAHSARRAIDQYHGVTLDDQPMQITLMKNGIEGRIGGSSRLGDMTRRTRQIPQQQQFQQQQRPMRMNPQPFSGVRRNNQLGGGASGGGEQRGNLRAPRKSTLTTEQLDKQMDEYITASATASS